MVFKNRIENICLQMDYTVKRAKKNPGKNGVKIVKGV